MKGAEPTLISIRNLLRQLALTGDALGLCDRAAVAEGFPVPVKLRFITRRAVATIPTKLVPSELSPVLRVLTEAAIAKIVEADRTIHTKLFLCELLLVLLRSRR